jgi:quinol monooxygenase YgiN
MEIIMFHKALQTAVILASIGMAPIASAQEVTTTIVPNAPVLTMVNVLTPADGNQEALVAQLQLALQSTLVHQPGFISGSVHKSLNSPHVVNYAQWADQASLEAFVTKLEAGEAPEMARVFTMATPDYHPYAVVSVHKPGN